MSDPIEDAMLAKIGTAPAQSGPADPVEASMLKSIAEGPKRAQIAQKAADNDHWYSPFKSVLDAAGGVAETVANGALGTAGALGGGLAEVAGLATGSTDRAQRWNEWAGRNIATIGGLYDPTPQTETGKGIQDVITNVTGRAKQLAGQAGDATLRATGSPLAATVADVGAQAVAQGAAALVGAKGAGLVRRGVSAHPSAIGEALDQGGGEKPLANTTQGLERPVVGGGAATYSSNPYPTLTGQQNVRGGDFPQIKLSQGSGDVSPSEQAVRSSILNEVMGNDGSPNDRLRQGPVTGNEDTLRTEATLAKAANPTPQGLILRDQFAAEQRALVNYAEKTLDKTGSMPGLLNDGMRGDLLNSALYGPESLRAYLSAEKGRIYSEAAERQGQNPVQLPTLDKLVNSPQLASTLKIAGQPNFLPGVSELVNQFKTNGFENPVTGEPIAPNSVAAAMELHKALNASWTPENSGYIGRLKRAIMGDVAQAGGADLYQRGNALHAAEQTLFQAPGLKRIFGDVDPDTGISKGLSSEKILPTINSLPFDQYSHIHRVFSDMAAGRVPGAPDLQLPPELQAAGAQARNEMAAALVRDVRDAGADKAGVWNANSVNKTLNAYSQKLNLVADPDVVADLHTLNHAGQLMPGMHSYEGAAQQARRMDQAGLLERNLPSLAGSAASLIHPAAGPAGMKAGELLQSKAAMARQMKQARELDAQMEAAAKAGRPLKDILK